MKKYKNLLLLSILGLLVAPIGLFLFPQTSFAQEGLSDAAETVESRGLVPCKQTLKPDGTFEDECDYGKLIDGVNTAISYFLYLATFIAVAMLAWGGFQYLVAAGNPTKRTDAKRMIQTVVVGILIVYSGWLIVYIILDNLISDDSGIDNPLK